MDYEYYNVTYKGELRKEEFDKLLPKAKLLIKSFIDDLVRTDHLQKKLDDYGDFDEALCLELDYLDQNGGIAAINGSSDLDLRQVQSSGYTFQVGTDASANYDDRSYKGIPFSPLARSQVITELRKKGLLSLGWNW